MGKWKLHWLDATGDLSPWRDRITAEVQAGHAAMAPFVVPPRLDILMERDEEATRRDTGMGASVARPNLLVLSFDPYNGDFNNALGGGVLRRQVVNAVHRAVRAAGPGYGFTLGGALVSEGLAAQFVRLVFGTSPEPWEVAEEATLAAHWPDQRTLMTTKYDAAEWFGGAGDKPFGYGYALGCRMVGHWLTSGVALNAERLINVPTPKVLAAAPMQARAG